MNKRMLSMLVAVVMIIGLLPTLALATEGESHHTCSESCGHIDADPHKTVSSAQWVAVSTQTQLQNAAENGGNVYLAGDISLVNGITVAENKSLTLCLNGKKLFYAGAGKVTILTVNEGATLNITDCGTNVRAGYISADTGLWTEGTGSSSDDTECNLVGGVIAGGTGSTSPEWGIPRAGAILNMGAVFVYGGNIASNKVHHAYGGDGGAVFNCTGADFYMCGGTITGNSANESIICNYEENQFVFTGDAVFQHNSLTTSYTLLSTTYGNGYMEISGNACFNHNSGGTILDCTDEPLVVKGNVSFTDNTVNTVLRYVYDIDLEGKDFRMDGSILMERNVKANDGSPAVDIDLDYTYLPSAMIVLTSPLTRSYTLSFLYSLEGGVLAVGDGVNVTALTAADAEKFTDVDGRTITAANDVLYVGRVILEQPSADNGYTVTATENPTYQWKRLTVENYIVTDEKVDWNGESYDSVTGKWTPSSWGSSASYFDIYLFAGDTITLTFDGPVADDVIMLEYSLYNGYIATPGEGNTYTFTAPYDGEYGLILGKFAGSIALSNTEPEYPLMTAWVNGKSFTALDGQTAAELNTDDLESGMYVCEVTWPAEDQYDDPYVVLCEAVAYHTHEYTYTADGNVLKENCTCGHEETATIIPPAGDLTYDGAEKTATVTYSDGWLGGELTVSYTPDHVAAGNVTASITKNGATASAQFEIAKLMHTVTYMADGEVVGTVEVEHGKDAAAPTVPAKEGYDAAWDKDGKNITADTVITAVYTENTSGEDAGEKPDLNPPTGDDFRLALWIGGMALSGIALALLLLDSKRRFAK